MINVKNQKTALFAIVAIAALVVVSTIAIGSGRLASAAETTTITKTVHNNGTNVQTETNQKQNCITAGGSSGIGGGERHSWWWGFDDDRRSSGSCTADSNDKVESSGGILHK